MNHKLEMLKGRRERLVADSPAIKIPKDQKKVIEGVMDKINAFLQSSDKESFLPRFL